MASRLSLSIQPSVDDTILRRESNTRKSEEQKLLIYDCLNAAEQKMLVLLAKKSGAVV
jgi:hypothetical protein